MSEVFVFGSNLSGRHGAGSALEARKRHGAIYGRGVGPQGASYAIPTKDRDLQTLPLEVIADYVRDFLAFLGITDVEFVYAEGLNMGEDSKTAALAAAHGQVAELAA